MNKDNIIICVSSFNNYDMLENEVLKNIDTEGFEFINIDDKSSNQEVHKGREICKKNNIVFLENKSKGVQYAVDTLIDFIEISRPNCKWVVIFQHDNYPLTPNFFNRLSSLVEKGIPEEISSLGFNNLDEGEYTDDSLLKWKNGQKPIGLVGKLHLSVKNTVNRWAAPAKNSIIKSHPENFSRPFSIEIPLEASIGINVRNWRKYIKPTTDYGFHLWFPDVMMQFLYNNTHCVILPDLYCMNNQFLKPKYGIAKSSAGGAMSGDLFHFDEYGPHLVNFKKRWGWDYENTSVFPIEPYKDTLIGKFYSYDFNTQKRPLFTFDLEY